MNLNGLLEYFPPGLLLGEASFVACFVLLVVVGMRRGWNDAIRTAFLACWIGLALLALLGAVAGGERRMTIAIRIVLAILAGSAIPLAGSSIVLSNMTKASLGARAAAAAVLGALLAPVAIIVWIATACFLGGGACI